MLLYSCYHLVAAQYGQGAAVCIHRLDVVSLFVGLLPVSTVYTDNFTSTNVANSQSVTLLFVSLLYFLNLCGHKYSSYDVFVSLVVARTLRVQHGGSFISMKLPTTWKSF